MTSPSSLGALTSGALRAALAGPGALLPCGPFHVRLRTRLPEVAAGVQLLYADFPLLGEDQFADFAVEVLVPHWTRHHWRPQVTFDCDGRRPFKPLPRDQGLAMMEWGLNWVLTSHAHDWMLIHAAVVERGGRALVIAADPGSGKSTLCAALVHRGWRLLSDELAMVSLADGRLLPIARPISLKNASIPLVQGFGPEVTIGPMAHDTAKGTVAHMKPPAASVAARQATALPGLILFPKFTAGAALEIEPVGPAHALLELVRHTFNYSVLAGEAFDALAGLVERAPALRLRYGGFAELLPALDARWAELG